MQVGDMVTMREFNAPPVLYGVGVILERIQLCENPHAVRLRVLWSGGHYNDEPAPARIGNCHPRVLRLLSESRDRRSSPQTVG